MRDVLSVEDDAPCGHLVGGVAQEHVGRLDVTMHHAAPMGVGERVGHLAHDAPRLVPQIVGREVVGIGPSDLGGVVAGHGLEGPVHSTMRGANDMGYECLLVLDAATVLVPGLAGPSRSMVEMSGGIFGAVGRSADVVAALRPHSPVTPAPALLTEVPAP